MLKVSFKNARVEDNGYRLYVNGMDLEKILSTALSPKVRGKSGNSSGISYFESNCCNVTVIIDPQPITEKVEMGGKSWDSIKDMEADMCEQYQEKDGEAES